MIGKVLVEFTIKNVCQQEDLEDSGMTFDEMVRWLIKEEGLFGICEDVFEVKSVVES